ncbi:uncharacterized protein LOC135713262 [Ochlerotatus camptorhynchus]|uniref:uncharacterized protein LOC135713262 n=1 Tax=Ochlerotatus camptorhynchus TaxID=644619 RepID=UPI0031D187AF
MSTDLIKAFVDSNDEETGACEIPVRLDNLDALWTEFKLVQSELETLDEATIDQQLKQRTDFETAYYRVKGFLLSNNKTPSTPCLNTALSSQIPASSSSHVRLPDVKLPVFNGNLDNWLNFHDLFVSLVHASLELSNIQKFYYLRSSLAGDALKLVQTIPISANNYPVAWNLLVDHFQNPSRLKQSYLDALFEFPTLKRESAAELHSLVEKFEANVKVLKQLGEKTEFWDIILIRMLSIRLDPTTRRDWEEYSSTKDAIAFNNLTSFIQRRVTVLQTIQGKVVEAPAFTQQLKKSAQRPVASHGASQFNFGRKCIVCSDHHPLYLCLSFAKLDLVAKEREVRRHQLCRNCLRQGHHARDCPSASSCRKCRGRHHIQLCSEEKSVAANSRTTDSSQTKTPTTSTSGEQPMASVSAVVNMVDDNGTAHVARALLDSGSECCFITESFSQLVKAKRYKVSVPISGIGQSSTYARYKIVSTVRSRVCDYSTSVEFLVLPKVTIDLPTASFDASSWKIPLGVQLADPAFYNANPIDIIIGAEVFFDLFKFSGRIQLGNSLPTLVNSVLGWIVSGKASYGTPTTPVIANVATVAELHQWMEKFWAIEENDTSPCYSVEEAACEEHFQRSVRHNSEGRYIVRLPIKDDVIKQIGDNRRTAVYRFRMLEGRLGRNSELAQPYRDFIDEYLALGHMKQVFDYQSPPSPCYHMPHHAVVREESTTTKLRVVFDASCTHYRPARDPFNHHAFQNPSSDDHR